MRLREICRAENSDMVPAQIDKDEERVDCSVADTSPTRHRATDELKAIRQTTEVSQAITISDSNPRCF
ncbi:hypothetical protein Q5P01_019783 [Channa striata]|uniref:Uncharacterized protein n=1 Tax=Channa striata TaxID=64152 RepID=A0AA88SE36_CHASR|nr:hypothetical protein Q5P01_019783 [Channa striata]